MNCPGHVQIFNHGLRSYRDLPLRYGEFGSCHRNEPSGALHGIMRVRGFTQDDGHIFCTEDQIEAEVRRVPPRRRWRSTRDFGFTDIDAQDRAAARTSASAPTRSGTRPRTRCATALRACGVEWQELPGEGAFYGPKIEYHLKDAIGRAWQCGTMQVDFIDAGAPGRRIRRRGHQRATHPVMLHRAIVGSMERFIGILIEHHAGALPAWLAPVQAVVLNITDAQADYVAEVGANPCRNKASGSRPICATRRSAIKSANTRCKRCRISWSSATGRRRRAPLPCVPASGEDLGIMPLADFVEALASPKARGR